MSLLYAGTSWGQTKASNWSALADKANAQESIRIIVQLTEDTADGSDLSSAQGWEPDQCWRLRRRLQQRFLDPQYHNKYRGLGATAKQQHLVRQHYPKPQLRSRFHLALRETLKPNGGSSRRLRNALLALTKTAQQVMRIEASAVAIIPLELQSVQPHRIQLEGPNRIGNRSGFDLFLATPFIDAMRARAFLPQQFNRIHRLMAIRPSDAQSFGIHLLNVLG